MDKGKPLDGIAHELTAEKAESLPDSGLVENWQLAKKALDGQVEGDPELARKNLAAVEDEVRRRRKE